MSIIDVRWKLKILHVFLSDKTSLKFVLGCIALFCSIGCFFGTPAPDNYILLKNFSPMWGWGIAFTILALGHIGCAAKLLSEEMEVLISAIGLWLWSCIVASFIIAGSTPFAPFQLMILGIICGEVWLLTHSLFFHKGDWSKKWLRR